MSDTLYRFKGQAVRMNKYGQQMSSWDSPQEFTAYAFSALAACKKAEKSLGEPGAGYKWGFSISSKEEVARP